MRSSVVGINPESEKLTEPGIGGKRRAVQPALGLASPSAIGVV